MPGGLEGASVTARETVTWQPSWGSPDQIVNAADKGLIDARSTDTAQNDAWAQSAVTTHRDSIVGSRFTLNAKPDFRTLGMTTASVGAWADEFQEIVEARFNAVAESDDCWLDVARRRTLTEMCRQAVGSTMVHGEIVAPAEWVRDADRPCRTAIHLISPTRLCNPYNQIDTRYLRNGIHVDYFGRHLGYWIRQGFPTEWYDDRAFQWIEVPTQLLWGRRQMAYISEPLLVEQTRSVGDMSAALPHMRTARKHSQLALQKAVIGATYAAVLETDLPPAELAVAMGTLAGRGVLDNGEQLIEGWENAIGTVLTIVKNYMEGSNRRIDGSQIQVTPPGTTMKMLNADNGGGASYDMFEASLNRKAAAALNMSYEEYSRDYSRTNYSSAKASGAKTERFMNARKKFTCDRLASYAFNLWLEEELANPDTPIPLPPTWTDRSDYYKPLMKAAIGRCEWIGTGSGQIDELKETQAAILRIRSGLSTWERECAKLGIDWREMAQQQSREAKLFQALALSFTQDAQKPTDKLQTGDTNIDPSTDPTEGGSTSGEGQ